MTRRTESDEPSTGEALYDAFAPSLYQYAWSLLGEDTEQVAEAVHEGLVAGVALDSRRADPEDRGPWLYALVRSACQRRGLTQVSPYTRLATVPAEEPVARMFERLPASHRELVELNLRHALPTSAVARVLGLETRICGELSRSAVRRAAASLTAAQDPDTGRSGGEGFPEEPNPEEEESDRAAIWHAQVRRLSQALSLLRPPDPPPGLRERVVRTCEDPDMAGLRARLAARMHPLTSEGYPLHRARVAADPAAEEAPTRTPGPRTPPRALPGDRLTTGDHPAHEETATLLAGPGAGPDTEERPRRRRWPLPAVSGLATVALAVALWSWASTLGGHSTVIDAGPEDPGPRPSASGAEARAADSDTGSGEGPGTASPSAPSERTETEAGVGSDTGSSQQGGPAPEEGAPPPPAGDPGPPEEEGGSGTAPEDPAQEAPGDPSPGGPPEEEEEESDDGGDEGLFDGWLGALFGGG